MFFQSWKIAGLIDTEQEYQVGWELDWELVFTSGAWRENLFEKSRDEFCNRSACSASKCLMCCHQLINWYQWNIYSS